MGQADGRVGDDADVLGDAPVRVVVLAFLEQQLVVVAAAEPLVEQALGHPASPVQLQPAFDMQVQGGDQHGQQEDHGEGGDLHQQRLQRAVFQGIEQFALPVAGPDHQTDLAEGQRQQQGHGAADGPLALAAPVGRGQAQKAPALAGWSAAGLHGLVPPRQLQGDLSGAAQAE